MELLQQPEVKSKYDKCKYTVKYWEHQFKKKNGRLPSKLDIKEASHDIRLAYKTYFNLKSAALEQSFQDIDGFSDEDDQENLSNTPNISSTEASINCSFNNKSLSDEENKDEEVNDSKQAPDDSVVSSSPSANTLKTWGTHLNNLTGSKTGKTAPKVDANSSFTKKLFKNSSFSKRNPRKSLSFHHRKSETNLNASTSSTSLSQPTGSSANTTISTDFSSTPDVTDGSQNSFNFNFNAINSSNNFDILNSAKVRVTKIVEPVHTKSLNIAQSVYDEGFKSIRSVDAGWMKRVAVVAGTKLINKNLGEGNFALSQQIHSAPDYDSDDIISDSDEEQEEEDSKLHFTKKRKLNDGNSIQVTNQEINSNPEPAIIVQTPVVPETENVTVNLEKEVVTSTETEIIVSEVVPKKRAASKAKKVKPETKAPSAEGRKSTRNKKTLVELKPSESDEEDPFANDEENDPDFSLTKEKPTFSDFTETDPGPEVKAPVEKNKKSTGVTKGKKKPAEKQATKTKEEPAKQKNEEETDSYELEFSIKPRRITVPRDPNFKNVIKKSKAQSLSASVEEAEPLIKSKQRIQLEKLEKKVASGNLNDNFVRINIQKKIYARGKKTMNFSKYKKKMFKQHKKNTTLCGPEMDMGGCDGGQLTCFNCGKVGHFAAKCPAEKENKLLPLAAGDEDYCPFPTLEEASVMAKGSQLAVRKARQEEGEGNADQEDKTADGEAQPDEKLEGVDGSGNSNSEDEDSDEDDDNEYSHMFEDDGEEDLLAETFKLEEYVKKVDEQQFIDNSRVIKPYYQPNEDGGIMDTPQEVLDVMEMFGHSSFRHGQEKAIMRILSGQSTLVTLSTGSGKSLCYQIPAYLYAQREPCITLVISPLVSLMEDQVTGIPKFLKAECLHTNKTKMQRERILNTISTGDLHVLLVSPEAVVAGEKQTGFGSLLRKLPPIAFACIDEAHCVSQWSHNFRPSYLMICSILKERLGVKTILGLTATATRATSDSIIRHLSIPDGRKGIISDTPLPNNLRLTVSKDGNRDQALLNLLISERFENLKSIIVYCTRRQECERVASFLRTSLKNEKPVQAEETTTKKRKKTNVQAEPYHAGLPASKRRSIQNSFMRGDLRIVVATVAFGMGINKSDIRAVIHYNLPRNFESYVQEVGRAGRDGLPAHCHLFLDSQGRDEDELQRHIFSDSIDRHVIRKLLAKIFVPCTCKGKCPKHEVAFSIELTVQALDIPEENISTLLCYLELHDKKYIEVLSPAYVTCKITAYGTANYIRKAAQDCPPLAMALAMFADKDNDKDNVFEFPIVDVASAMGWDSGICKYKLKNLEWVTENNQPKRSFLTVQFLNLGFRLLAPGNLGGEQLDDALDTLHQRVVDQEKCSLLQLRSLHETVISVAETTYRMCISDQSSDKEVKLKHCIREYFDSPLPLDIYELKSKQCDEGLIVNDVRVMINMYRDNSFTGRALARIFYGIQSPNYPAVVWGRCKYWRAHINLDFHKIVQIATREILRHR